MLEIMRGQVAACPAVQFRDQKALDAADIEGGFRVTLENGEAVTGTKLLLAFASATFCPRFPAWSNVGGEPSLIVPIVTATSLAASGSASSISANVGASIHLDPRMGPTTFFLNGGAIEPEVATKLDERGVTIEPEPVDCLVGEGLSLSAIRLRNGVEQPLDALLVGPRNRFNSDIVERLGCAVEGGPLGSVVTVDEMQATNVAGVYAAGDITRMGHAVTFACADGVMAALEIHRSLVFGG